MVEFELLRGLSEEQVDRVLSVGRRRRFGRREVIWHEGDRAETVHFIRAGRIGVRATTSMGESVTVAVLGPGEVAGMIGALASDPYASTSGHAVESTETVAIRLDALNDVRRQIPSVNEAVMRFLADRALNLTAQLVDALYVPADARVLMRLYTLCRAYGREDGEVTIPLTQEDLAELAGVARPTVNRVLKREERRGTIRLSRGTITVLDVQALAPKLR